MLQKGMQWTEDMQYHWTLCITSLLRLYCLSLEDMDQSLMMMTPVGDCPQGYKRRGRRSCPQNLTKVCLTETLLQWKSDTVCVSTYLVYLPSTHLLHSGVCRVFCLLCKIIFPKSIVQSFYVTGYVMIMQHICERIIGLISTDRLWFNGDFYLQYVGPSQIWPETKMVVIFILLWNSLKLLI